MPNGQIFACYAFKGKFDVEHRKVVRFIGGWEDISEERFRGSTVRVKARDTIQDVQVIQLVSLSVFNSPKSRLDGW